MFLMSLNITFRGRRLEKKELGLGNTFFCDNFWSWYNGNQIDYVAGRLILDLRSGDVIKKEAL